MPVDYVASSLSGTSDSFSASCTTPVPAGAAAGHIALYAIEQWESANPTVTWPTGFTQFINLVAGSQKLKVAWKRLTGADTGNYVATWTGSQWNQGQVILISGALASGDPIGSNFNTASGSGTNVPTTSLTIADLAFLAHFVANENSATKTPPTSFTEVRDANYLATNYRIPGATGTYSASGGTLSASTPSLAALIAISPAAGGFDGAVSGTVAISSALSGTVSGSRPTSGTVPTTSAATGSVASKAGVSGAVTVVSTSTGAAAVLAPASGAVEVVSTATGAANIAGGLAASGSVAVTSAATGSAASKAGVSGAVAVVSTASGAAAVRLPVSGVAPVVSSASGSPDIGGSLAASGQVTITSATSGSVGQRHAVATTVAAVSAVSGSAGARLGVGGVVGVVSTVSGSVGSAFAATAAVAVISTTRGAAGRSLAAVGAVVIVSTTSGSPQEGGWVGPVPARLLVGVLQGVRFVGYLQPGARYAGVSDDRDRYGGRLL